VIRIREEQRLDVLEHGASFRKRHTMLAEIARRLEGIPLK